MASHGASGGSSPATPQVTPLAKYKIVILGDQGVGKTSLLTRFMYESFEENYLSTVGIDFCSKTMYLEDRTIRLQIWDTAGQERFRTLIPSYIRDSSVAIIAYDITNRYSFNNITTWIEDVRAERGSDVIIMIVANKIDLADRRKVTLEELQKKAAEENVLFMETSAKAGYNVRAMFAEIGKHLPGNDAPDAASGNNVIDITLEDENDASAAATDGKSGCAC